MFGKKSKISVDKVDAFTITSPVKKNMTDYLRYNSKGIGSDNPELKKFNYNIETDVAGDNGSRLKLVRGGLADLESYISRLQKLAEAFKEEMTNER